MQEQEQIYRHHLFSNDVSSQMNDLIERNFQNNYFEILLRCQLCCRPVPIPVRHSSSQFKTCIFDLDCWMAYYQTDQRVEQIFHCPGCKTNQQYQNYGIDYKLFHVIESFKLLQQNYPQVDFNKEKLILSTQSIIPTYFAQNKVLRNSNEQCQKFQIPGIAPISKIQKQIQNNNSFNPTQKQILEEISYTCVRLQQYINNKIYRQAKKNNQSFTVIQAKVKNKSKELKKVFNNAMKLIKLTLNQLSNEFIFALKIVSKQNINESILVVYFVNFGVWHEFSLLLDGNPYLEKKQALYIKGESKDENFIYIIGGRTQNRYEQSNQVVKINFPKDPFQDGTFATMEKLPSLPEGGYNFMGTCYQNNVYVFYGQQEKKNKDNLIFNKLIDKAYVMRQKKPWQLLISNLIPRFDGSFFVRTDPQLSKLMIIFGGIQHDPQGFPQFQCTQQNRCQIFKCQDEIFLGNKKMDFNLCFSINPEDFYQQNVLCTPVFSAPYYGQNQLILSGDFLRYLCLEQGEIYTFDWANGVLKKNEIFSLDPREQILNQRQQTQEQKSQQQFFLPIQDMEGAVSFGNFYVIHQYHVCQGNKVVLYLLRINLANGFCKHFILFQVFTIPFQDHQTSLQEAIQRKKSLLQS